MNLSQETIKELQEILKNDCGEDFTFSETTKIADCFVGVYDLLTEINYQKNNKD